MSEELVAEGIGMTETSEDKESGALDGAMTDELTTEEFGTTVEPGT